MSLKPGTVVAAYVPLRIRWRIIQPEHSVLAESGEIVQVVTVLADNGKRFSVHQKQCRRIRIKSRRIMK